MVRAIPFVALVAATFVGCASSRTPPAKEAPKPCEAPSPVLNISAGDRVNASGGGQGRPVQVRVYQLKSDARIKGAKFEDVWQNDATALQSDLIKVDEHTVFPGQTKAVKVSLNADARSIAVVALFREPQGKSWLLTYDIDPPKKEPPCPNEPKIPIWIDRMQIEDGQGRSTGSDPPGAKGD
jgi:type VI secretion system protein VasD